MFKCKNLEADQNTNKFNSNAKIWMPNYALLQAKGVNWWSTEIQELNRSGAHFCRANRCVCSLIRPFSKHRSTLELRRLQVGELIANFQFEQFGWTRRIRPIDLSSSSVNLAAHWQLSLACGLNRSLDFSLASSPRPPINESRLQFVSYKLTKMLKSHK